ncbi:hypothetical protein P154DRAFT_67490, partial [Amniculicola lignicola CBS 123094]
MASDVKTQAPLQRICAVCNAKSTLRCAVCKVSRYCTVAHANTDAPIHNCLCRSLFAFKDRPHPDARRAILFPANGPAPQWVWINTRSGSLCSHLITNEYIGENKVAGMRLITEMKTLRRRLKNWKIAVVHDRDFLEDGEPTNKAIRYLGRTPLSEYWGGNLVLCRADNRTEENNDQDLQVGDLDPGCLGYLVEFFKGESA